MAEKITMPRLSDTMEEGTVVKWHKKVGDKVTEGDILAEIETDKAIQEFESEYDGFLLFAGVEEGKTAKVDSILAIIGKEGEDIADLTGENSSDNKPEESSSEKTEAEAEEKDSEDSETEQETETSAEIPDNVNVISMPRLSDTMEEGTVAKWHKAVGDKVSEGDILAEIETDKAVQEFESEYDGTLLYIGAEEGKSAPVDTVLAIIGPEGTDVSGIISGGKPKEKKAEAPKEEKKETEIKEEKKAETAQPQAKSSEPVQNMSSSERVFASPLAKNLAKEKGINLQTVKGSGDHGRITKKDIENYKPQTASAAVQNFVKQESKSVANSQMRKVIAKRLAESKFTAPHYYLNVEVDMDNCMSSREQINKLNPESKISFNDIIVKACALALRKHPQVNSSWKGDETLIHGDINIGVAVAVEDGLLVPVIKNTDFKSFAEISGEVKDMAKRARDRKLKADEMEGSTFSVSNLGMFGIESFTSIINQPNSCILSVGAIIQKPVVKNGQIVVGNTMKLSMACDHRTVDGATGAQFLQTLVLYLENPITMFV
ncbi:pyruvate dehydrogenase complex dihydrolipoamide acetyltransferase [Moheibacter sediminis]|uniref:Acetyltransferase component of pyruvate dehydrogenase complex n=1 Tax=Moheibacter sediminis TaxID=1434700 RepID=A0A1W2AIT4_9FLAO|nr:pyruvate dehydrogenase complex dihydrolipoamide acetyltransferase [Moheibacter sediminis]SMC60615.1 pyruvate dehydrogenase E2 component (dihydrolipoamide acetyltransferase) [Moheibacter sediminis]